MNYINSLKKEFGLLFKNKNLRIMSAIILLIPCLYAGFFVYSYFDPYGRIKNVPLVLVNNDKGTTADEKEIVIGNDLANELKKSKDLNVTELNQKQAKQALKDNKYYIEIEIPSDFSENAMSAMDAHPEKAQLSYIANEGYNNTAASVGSSILEKVKEKLGDNVTKAYTKALLKAQKDIGNGMSKLADGGVKLTDGLSSAKSGTDKLSNGLKEFAKGTIQFNQGMSKLTGGANSAASGSSQLVAGSEKFNQGLSKIGNGSSRLSKGAQSLSEKSVELQNGIQQMLIGTTTLFNQVTQDNTLVQDQSIQLNESVIDYANQIDQTTKQIGEYKTNTNKSIEDLKKSIQNNDLDKQQVIDLLNSFETQLNKETQKGSTQDLLTKKDSLIDEIQSLSARQQSLSDRLGKLKAGQEQLLAGASAFSDGQAQFAQGMKGLNEGIIAGQTGSNKLLEGYQSLSNGLNQLATGSNKLSDASTKISDGAGKLNDGTSQLADGLEKLTSGSGKLSNALTTVDDKLKEHQFTVNKAADAISKPVSLDSKPINHVKKYGDGFAPYGLTLGLYVGLFLFTSVFPLLEIGSSKTGVSWFLGKLTIVFGVGVIQAIIVDILLLIIGVHVEHMTKFFLLSILTSWTFGAIFLFIQSAFGHYGRFICMFFLVLQLTSSGGTFPIEMLPKFFNNVHQWIPMTYSILGFKSVISIHDNDLFISSVQSLLIFFCIGFILSISYFVYRFKKSQNQIERSSKARTA
ncbi:YhgE/Pip domain-containing protein [Bacillus sp. EAC]|uniref:YhgE/Pip domain-containing protein n=1 Tax=Bacillus sp. EAC TaxID=1978338 RepID=UPI000B446138|nr:YhgE/Pip domain-containing protein [Bacillus sp. EAC]